VEEWEAPLGRSWEESWSQWDWSQPTPLSVLQAWGVEVSEEWMKRYSPGAVEECLRKRDGRLWDRSVGTDLLDVEEDWNDPVGIRELMNGHWCSVIFTPGVVCCTPDF